MKECMETDKPLVSIVMATYNPRMDWFREQLVSLNDQSYDSMELLILDDFSSDVSIEDIQRCVKKCITRIPYQIYQNEANLGSTKTFEKLTKLASGEYIAYCDQDDIWQEDKIKTLLNCFTNTSINLAYSDVRIIDEYGRKKANSITEFRKRHILYEGPELSEKLIIQNFVMGCSMLIKREVAQNSMPFIDDMVHDHYLALMASLDGELALFRNPLISYRIHKDNQTNTLAGIKSKTDYCTIKIKSFLNRIEQLKHRNVGARIPEFNNIQQWAEARDFYYNGNIRYAKLIWKYRYFDLKISLFELIMMKMPGFLFQYTLDKIRKGRI